MKFVFIDGEDGGGNNGASGFTTTVLIDLEQSTIVEPNSLNVVDIHSSCNT